MKNPFFCMAIAIVLTSCAYPGSQMDTDTAAGRSIRLVAITPNILSEQSRQDRMELAQMPIRELAERDEPYVYRVGPQDVLSITVWDHPELTIPAGEFRSAEAAGHLVAEDGTIFYPFVGQVQVTGMTVAEIRRMLTNRLSSQIRDPQLDVRVADFRSQRAYVVGEVAQPGVQPITDVALTALEAISRAGDVTATSDMRNVTLTRDGITYDIDVLALYEYGDIAQNVVLRHGDILNVPDRNLQKVFVLGAVVRPDTQIMHKGRLTLAEALSDAGGINEKDADATEVYVVRGTPAEPLVYYIDARSPGALILADNFSLQPRDVVYVETSGGTRATDRLERLAVVTRMIFDLAAARERFVEEL
jgi:polysaccharide export outer membrane protein